MAEGSRQARAVEAQGEAKARSARRQPSDPETVTLAGPRPAVARMLAARAGNAAAVRALHGGAGTPPPARRAPTTAEPMPAPAQETAPTSPAAAGPESTALPEPEPTIDSPGADTAPALEEDAGPESQPLPEPEPTIDSPGADAAPESMEEDAAPQPASEIAPYRQEMIRLITETAATRTSAQATVTDYSTAAMALSRAADPGELGDVPEALAGKAATARAQYLQFEAAAADSEAELQGIIDGGDADYEQALADREGLQTGPEALAWLRRVAGAQGTYQGVSESRAEVLKGVVDSALAFANIGKELQQADYIAGVLSVADRAQTLSAQDAEARTDLFAPGAAGTLNDSVSTGFSWGDALNNSGAVVASSFSLAYGASLAGAMAVFGTASTIAGVVFAGIGTLLAIRASMSAGNAKARLAAAERYLSNDTAKDAAAFGKKQKGTKEKRQAALAALGAVTIGAGIVGLVIGSMGALIIPLAIAGLAIAAVGLGLGVYKYFHRKRKRAQEATAAAELADRYVQGAEAGDPESAAMLAKHGGYDGLKTYLANQVENKRHHTAVELVRLVASSTPSERFNGTAVLEALDVNPQAVLNALNEGNPDVAVGLVERKLASW